MQIKIICTLSLHAWAWCQSLEEKMPAFINDAHIFLKHENKDLSSSSKRIHFRSFGTHSIITRGLYIFGPIFPPFSLVL